MSRKCYGNAAQFFGAINAMLSVSGDGFIKQIERRITHCNSNSLRIY